ncbi:MAG: ATP-dependent helicase [Desulfobacteraceae bacterium]|nr:ATP-dependent helicase [Desulfobacteraceae bacterium]
MEATISKSFRKESRIPNCFKYELPDAYRIVFQKVDGVNDTFLALFVGSHSDVDHFLDKHKGWVFDPKRHTLKEVRLMTVETEHVNIAVSPDLQAKLKDDHAAPSKQTVFFGLDESHLKNAGVPDGRIQKALSMSDPDSLDVMMFLDELPEKIADLLLSFITGSEDARNEIKLLLEQKREFHPFTTSVHSQAIDSASDEFIDLRELPEEKIAFDSYQFEDWMLFLHPDQKPLVSKKFNGPARLRGVSGSGKTVVAIHRAQHFARKILEEGSQEKVLFITFNKSLADLVTNLVEKLCLTREKYQINVLTMDKWCRDYIQFRMGEIPFWNETQIESTWFDSVRRHYDQLVEVGLVNHIFDTRDTTLKKEINIQFLRDEVDFIYGKFVHIEAEHYLSCSRAGRVRRLPQNQRNAILELYKTFSEKLIESKQYTSSEVNRVAYTLLEKGEQPKFSYKAIIVDEVQDLSEIELRTLRNLAGEEGEKLFLVGDGAQRIYTRGYSMKNIGINVVGRSFILKKNYRNTKEIIETALALMEREGIGKYDEDPDASQVLAKKSGHTSEKPLLLIAKSPEQEWNTIAKEIKYLTNRLNINLHEICCLARTKWERDGLKDTFLKLGLEAVEYRADGIVADDCIKITSLHNSKGHEFRVIFIAGFFDGAIPLYKNTRDPENLEREAALLYVAMTRAKHLLYLSYPQKDQNGRDLSPSRFIDGIRNTIDIIHI